jgi:predicted O-linked N-acetylglucosamine transferase (SPINDLY family)
MDYIIGDPWTLPAGDERFFTEKVARLPHSWFAHDSTTAISSRVPTRAEEGLPERGFVFCCFNNSYKITPTFFAVWMRLLREVPNGVLWLARNNDFAAANLARAAKDAGVDPGRLVFAKVRPAIEEHLARHQLADLFLDTLPYNAQMTAIDALWAGLPAVTCAGRAFAGRAAMSMLHDLDLAELIARDLEGYEQLAIALARDPPRLKQIRQKLAGNRLTAPLFDTARLCADLEAAYTTMTEIRMRGERPQNFSVDANRNSARG